MADECSRPPIDCLFISRRPCQYIPFMIRGILSISLLAASSLQAQRSELTFPLSLDRAIAMALEHNLDIAIQRESVRSAEAGLQESRGIFDPNLSSGVSLSEDQRTLDAESSTAAGGLKQCAHRAPRN